MKALRERKDLGFSPDTMEIQVHHEETPTSAASGNGYRARGGISLWYTLHLYSLNETTPSRKVALHPNGLFELTLDDCSSLP